MSRNLRFIALAGLIALLPQSIRAQTREVTGKVVEAITGNPAARCNGQRCRIANRREDK